MFLLTAMVRLGPPLGTKGVTMQPNRSRRRLAGPCAVVTALAVTCVVCSREPPELPPGSVPSPTASQPPAALASPPPAALAHPAPTLAASALPSTTREPGLLISDPAELIILERQGLSFGRQLGTRRTRVSSW